MPIFQTVAAACRAAGEKLRSWKQKKRTDRLWRVVLWGILWAMLCPTLGACGAQREELFLSEKESIAYGDGSYVAESDVEDTDQNREAETNAGNTDQNREVESNAGDTDQNRKAEPSAGSTDRTELSDASSEETKTLVVHICGAVSAPGVYELPAGSRIIDAVEAGGGFLPEAEEACCNLAEGNRGRLSDLYHDKIGKLRRRTDRKESRDPDFAGQRYANDRQKCAKQQRSGLGERSGQPQHSGYRCTHDAAWNRGKPGKGDHKLSGTAWSVCKD